MSRYTVSTILVGQKRLFTLSNHRNAVIKITICGDLTDASAEISIYSDFPIMKYSIMGTTRTIEKKRLRERIRIFGS